MKKTLKTKLVIGTFAVALGAVTMFPQLSHATSADAQDRLWGALKKVEKLATGSEIRYYGENVMGVEIYRIIEVQNDGKVIFKGVSLTTEKH